MRVVLSLWLPCSVFLFPLPLSAEEGGPVVAETAAGALSHSAEAKPGSDGSPVWHSDYGEAVRAAQQGQKMLLILFSDPKASSRAARFRDEILAHSGLGKALSKYVLLELATDATIQTATGECTLLRTQPLAEMLGLDGVAIADYSDPASETYESVVSVFPFLHGEIYDLRKTQVILDLPPGTLTQRTLIYAVRTHPEGPQSTRGQFHPNLGREARWHSGLMARLRRSGHHQWETRFHRINRQIPGGLTATEVAAESWPGQRLLAAAIECVRCWRLSSGHWRAVRASHPCYGYDMRRGSNGVWYATGIFGARNRY